MKNSIYRQINLSLFNIP